MRWFTYHPALIWLTIAVLLAVLELISLDSLFLMLALGALVGMLATLLGADIVVAVLIALAVAVSLLFLLRPRIVERLHGGPGLKTGAEALIGSEALVTEQVVPYAPGRVKIGGEIWSASPADGAGTFEPGELVYVATIKGATAYVSREAPAAETPDDQPENQS